MEAWQSGTLYEGYMGRWSRLVAPLFLAWLNPAPGLRWLDVGCGTGNLTRAILACCQPQHVFGVDRSQSFVGFASSAAADPRAGFFVGDALAIPLDSGACDAAVSGLVLNFVSDPAAAIAEMKRVLRPGGRVAVFVWDYAEGMEWLRFFWDAARAVNVAAAAGMDQGERYAICRPDALMLLLAQAGLVEIRVEAVDVAAHFADFADYWGPLAAGGPYPAPTYLASRPSAEQEAIRTHLQTHLPFQPDGSIRFNMRAWSAAGEVP